jgi:hypothetical protein
MHELCMALSWKSSGSIFGWYRRKRLVTTASNSTLGDDLSLESWSQHVDFSYTPLLILCTGDLAPLYISLYYTREKIERLLYTHRPIMLSICSQLVTLYRTKVYSSTNISLYNKCAILVLFEHIVYSYRDERETHISSWTHTHTTTRGIQTCCAGANKNIVSVTYGQWTS